MKVNFKLQMVIFAILVVSGFVLSLCLKADIFYNLAWALVALILFINPVYPKNLVSLEEEQAKKGVRIAAVVIFFIGLTNGFGV